MHAADIMKTRVITVEMDDQLSMVHLLLEQAEIHHLPVVDGSNRLVGIISDRDYLKATTPFIDTVAETARDRNLVRKPVHQVMTRDPYTVTPETPVNEVARMMLFNGISSLPVVTGDKHIAGIITWKDLICHYTRQDYAAQAELPLASNG